MRDSERIVNIPGNTGDSPLQALAQVDAGDLHLPATARLLAKFRELRDELLALQPLTGATLLDYLFPDQAPFSVLREAATLAGVVDENMGASTLRESLVSAVTQPEMPEAGEYVRVMSLHKSKGLTSKVVLVAGCIQGLIPYLDADLTPERQQTNLEEQRRLFYVVITRAKELLVLSSSIRLERRLAHRIGARVRAGYGPEGLTIASRFIQELGNDAPEPVRGADWENGGYVHA